MRLILCADDYGMTPGISRGILALAAQGRISAASCMTSMPGWPAAAPAIAAHRGRIGIGLHLTLTAGRPLGAMPLIAPEGTFPALGELARRALARGARAELSAEIGRQIDAFTSEAGVPPDYVDGHQHAHVLPGVRAALFVALAARGLAGTGLWLRDPADSLRAIARRGVAVPKALVIAGLARGFRRAAARHGFPTNRGFAGVNPFDPARDFGADMARYLEAPGPAHLVMVHPGEIDAELAAIDPVVATRPIALAYLASDRFGALLAERGVTLVPGP